MQSFNIKNKFIFKHEFVKCININFTMLMLRKHFRMVMVKHISNVYGWPKVGLHL